MKSLKTLPTALVLGLMLLTNATFSQNEVANQDHFDASPIDFIENQGQWHENVNYKAFFEGRNALFIEDDGFTYLLSSPEDLQQFHDEHRAKPSPDREETRIRQHAYQVKFIGANEVEGKGIAERSAYHNYYLGNDPAKWTSHVSLFGKIEQQNIYEGIHLETYSQQGRLKYDFLVQPGADASKIKLAYEGADRLELGEDGLKIFTSILTITERSPIAWQVIDGQRVNVDCGYILDGETLSFDFPDGYDESVELIIDPTVVAATLSGSSSENFGHTATFDLAGNVYAGGISFGSGYPTTTGAFQTNYGGGGTDIGVSKYDSDGESLLFATYVGGSNSDYPHSLVTDFNQQLYIYGSSLSSNYPVTANAVQPNFGGDQDIIVTILNSDGSALVGSSYFGGSGSDGLNESFLNSNYGDGFRGEIILDNQNNVYVISSTSSINYPVSANAFQPNKSGGQDAVIFKANSDLSLVYWASYLGSSDPDIGNGIRVDNSNNVFVTGTAGDNDFPTTAGTFQDTWPGGEENAYLAKISSDGSSIIAGTFFGTSDGDEHSFFLDVDEEGNPHIYGQTTGTVDITPDTYFFNPGSSQFLASFTPDLVDRVYSTVIGVPSFFGGYSFVPVAFMVDKCNGIYFSGYYAASGLPTTPDAISTSGNSFYLAKLTPNAEDLDFGTYYGDSDHVDGGTSRFDKGGVVYQGVCSCSGSVLNTLPNAWATTQTGFCDIGVFKINFDIETVTANGIALPSTSGCAPYTVDFEFTGTNATAWEWSIDGSVISTVQNHAYTFDDAGQYEVQLVVTNPDACNPTDTLFLQIDVLDGESTVSDTAFCTGDQLILDATTANATYEWQDGSTAASFLVENTGVYWVDVMIDGCTRRDSFIVNNASGVMVDLGQDTSFCDGAASIVLDASNAQIASWEWQDGSSDPTFEVTQTGIYTVNYVDVTGCEGSDQIEITFGTSPTVSLGPDQMVCPNEQVTLAPMFSGGNPTWQDGSTADTYTVTSPGIYWLEVDNEGCIFRDSVIVDYFPTINPNEVGLDILCANDCNGQISVNPQGGAGGPYGILWSTGDDVDTVADLCPGDYNVTITDAEGCTNEAVAIVGAPEPLAMSLTIQGVECPGDADGAIEVTTASGGTPPYQYSIGGSDFTDINGAGLLAGGEYEVVLIDANDCSISESASVSEPDGFVISAGDDIEIKLGESTQLNSIVVPFNNQILQWSPIDFLECDNCLDPSLTPTQTTEYVLLATDPNSGCFQIDTVLVTVAKPRDVYIPNAFSPNGDGVNDFFTIYAGIGVERITELRIYDRWGELMYEFFNFQPNMPELGWDGFFKGEEMQNAVFVYAAFVEFKDGTELFYEGDFTLLR